MKIPVDNIIELATAAVDIERAKKTPVSVYMLIDETARPEFQVFVRGGFSSTSVNSRLMVGYVPTQKPDLDIDVDLVVIAAGTDPAVADLVAEYRKRDVSVLVVTEDGEGFHARIAERGIELSEHDVLAMGAQETDAQRKAALSDAIGSWIVAHVPEEKKLAFSIAYPFVRRPLAYDAVNITALENAGVGVLVFIPGADMPVMTLNQAKMVLKIAAIYGEPLTADRVKELAGVLLNAFVFRSVSRQIVSVVPVAGWAVKGTMGYLGTKAIGHASIRYFEEGGDLAGLAAVADQARTAAVTTAEAIGRQPLAKGFAKAAAPAVKHVASTVADHAGPAMKSVAKSAAKSFMKRPAKN